MKLNISILSENAETHGFQCIRNENPTKAIEKIQYFTTEDNKILCTNVLYILDASNISDFSTLLNMNKDISVVLCNYEQLNTMSNREEISFLLSSSTCHTVSKTYDILSSTFTSFADWKERILMQIMEQADMQTLIDSFSSMLTNPISILDNNCFILGRSREYIDVPAGTIWDMMKGTYLNIYDFYSTSEWKKIARKFVDHKNKAVLFVPEKDPQHTYLSLQLIVDGITNGSIGSMDINGSFTNGQIEILQMVAEMMQVFFRSRYHSSKSHTFIDHTFNDLINGTNNQTAIRKSLSKKHWAERGEYQMLSFESSYLSQSEMDLTSYINLIHMQFPKAMLGLKGNQIVLLAQVSDYTCFANGKEKLLFSFLKQYDLYAGISNVFHTFSNCCNYYPQCSFAASTATASDRRIVYYKDVQIMHFLSSVASNYNLADYCHPVVMELFISQKKSDHALLQCLKSYLLNGRSISNTARNLNLHRNTVIYRLQKLEGLLNLFFDNITENEISSLLISCAITDFKSKHAE